MSEAIETVAPAIVPYVLADPLALEACAAVARDDNTMPELCGVLVQADGTCTATDGHRLITVKPSPDAHSLEYPPPPDAERFHAPNAAGTIIPTDAVKAAVAASKKFRKRAAVFPVLRNVRVAVNEKSAEMTSTDLDSTARTEFRPVDMVYPNYRKIMPEGPVTYAIHLNGAQLAEVANALGKVGDDRVSRHLVFEFREPLQAVVIRTLNGRGKALLMPLRAPEGYTPPTD